MKNNILSYLNESFEIYLIENNLCLTETERVLVKLAFIEGALVSIKYLENKGG